MYSWGGRLTLINTDTTSATAAATYAGINLHAHISLLLFTVMVREVGKRSTHNFLKLPTIAATASSLSATGISSIAFELVPLITPRRSASERRGRRERREERAVLMKIAPPMERPKTIPMNWASIMKLVVGLARIVGVIEGNFVGLTQWHMRYQMQERLSVSSHNLPG